MPIKQLDPLTIDQIAAGEVIERPSSVVKELVENAIDASADRISVQITDGGKTGIRVTDNGCGIPWQELPLAVMRHATSKINTSEDLFSCMTLGFRGEALASIASVASLTIVSKEENGPGYRYSVSGGELLAYEETAAVNGTDVTVGQLFSHIPARKKYLKTDMTEAGHIQRIMRLFSLSHPEISFTLRQDGSEKLHTSGSGRLKDLVYELFGREAVTHMIPLSEENERIKISGYIGTPDVGRGNRSQEFYFLNGRIIQNQTISFGIEDGYKGFLMQHKYPFVVLFLEMPAGSVDINVHPAKADVRLREPQMIRDILSDTIKKALTDDVVIPKISFPQKVMEQPAPYPDRRPEMPAVRSVSKPQQVMDELYFLEEMRKRVFESHKQHPLPENTPGQKPLPPKDTSAENFSQESFLQESFIREKSYEIIGQIFDTYWLIQYEDEFLIVDQHAAHEKVLYEKIVREAKEGNVTTQMINPPVVVRFDIDKKAFETEYAGLFEKFGFEIEFYGENDFLVRGVPSELSESVSRDLLEELLDSLLDQSQRDRSLKNREDILATASCKAAVKGNMRITKQEMEHLFREMMKAENPYHCPHGRPTMIRMSKQELEKNFRRIV